VRVAGGADRSPTAAVATREGPVTGVLNEDRSVEIFAGIPYAEPPVGDLRWRAPQPPEPRDAVLVTDRFSPAPVQGTTTFFTRALAQLVQAPLEETLLNPYPVSEDSLTLNIWRSMTPDAGPLPVLVYLPGGGFATGSGALPLYDGEALASRGDVITVTINYRLGVLGFLSHPELTAESEHGASGNYGILDQLAALQWVRDNIAAFGGDPDRITLAGESAGGESVCTIGATPLAKGLVDGLIGGSGACMGTLGDTGDGDQYDTREVAEDIGRRLSEALGAASIDELRRMPVERIVEAAAAWGGHWRPSIDGYVLDRLPSEVYAAGDQLDVPMIAGSTADEASLALAAPPETDVDEYRASVRDTYGDETDRFLSLYPGETEDQVLDSLLRAQTDKVMTRAMYRWASLQSQTGESAAYLYFFSHVPPEPALEKYGAYHGAEIAYAFDNLGADSDAAYTATDYRLRDQLTNYWVNFTSTGDPNGPGLPSWPTFGDEPRQVMRFEAGSTVVPHPRADAVAFWMEFDGPIP
ncbi:carboxylesterase/lipase family protein, partial [Microbacterium sp.]|uniref:carboxylesterase/lipase family protein n=1 Tax=Microbacterium sp. TaxID=51671 RepID=UPI003C7284BA